MEPEPVLSRIDLKYKMGWLGEVEVPEGLIEIFQGWGIEGCKRDCEKCDLFDDCLSQFMGIERYEIYPDYIYPEDIAEFTVNYVCENDPDGPPFQADIEVGDWMVKAYGIVPYGEGASSWEPRMLAYRSYKHIASRRSGVKEIEDFDEDVSTHITLLIMKNLIETRNEFIETDDKSQGMVSLMISWKAAQAILDSEQWRDQIPSSMRSEFKKQFLESERIIDHQICEWERS